MENRIIASIKHEKQVYLFCGPAEVMQWPTMKAAGKFFKRFYSIIFRAGGEGIKRFHLLADFRLHSISVGALQDDRFERAVMKAEVDADKVFGPTDYPIVPIVVEGVTLQTIPCYGNSAESWHSKGIRPPFPKFR